MKLDAHPLVVAVALGLLGPAALASEDEEEGAAHASSPPDGPTSDAEWTPGPLPDADEIHRVEIEWLKQR